MKENGVYYVAQEIAMAPGISDGWPEIIPAPHTRNGRLVRREGRPEEAIEQCKRLRKALDTILMLDPAAEDAAFLAVTVAAEALDE